MFYTTLKTKKKLKNNRTVTWIVGGTCGSKTLICEDNIDVVADTVAVEL